jgi:hypothetical protein
MTTFQEIFYEIAKDKFFGRLGQISSFLPLKLPYLGNRLEWLANM